MHTSLLTSLNTVQEDTDAHIPTIHIRCTSLNTESSEIKSSQVLVVESSSSRSSLGCTVVDTVTRCWQQAAG